MKFLLFALPLFLFAPTGGERSERGRTVKSPAHYFKTLDTKPEPGTPPRHAEKPERACDKPAVRPTKSRQKPTAIRANAKAGEARARPQRHRGERGRMHSAS